MPRVRPGNGLDRFTHEFERRTRVAWFVPSAWAPKERARLRLVTTLSVVQH